MTPVRRYALVSDLHLGGLPAWHGPTCDIAFTQLAEELVKARARGEHVSLVLLGDFVDLQHWVLHRRLEGPPARRAVLALTSIAEHHPSVFQALRDAAVSGVALHVVPGNHDADLVRPQVWAAMSRLLAPDGAGRPQLHPWLFHVPGLVLAEHGHRHHDINRPWHPVRPFVRQDPEAELEASPARVLDRLRSGRREGAARAVVQAGLSLLRRGTPPSRGDVAELASSCALPQEVVLALWSHPVALPRLIRRLVARVLPSEDIDYLPAEVQRTVDALAESEVRVPLYVTGHTHRAVRRQVHARGRFPFVVDHLDAGTWSSLARGGTGSAGRPTWVELVEDGSGPPRADLRTW